MHVFRSYSASICVILIDIKGNLETYGKPMPDPVTRESFKLEPSEATQDKLAQKQAHFGVCPRTDLGC